MNHRKLLSDLIEKFDEADEMARRTSGETLSYWEGVRRDSEDEICAIIDDNFSQIDCARHMIASEAL